MTTTPTSLEPGEETTTLFTFNHVNDFTFYTVVDIGILTSYVYGNLGRKVNTLK